MDALVRTFLKDGGGENHSRIVFFRGKRILSKDRVGVNHNWRWRGRAFCTAFFHTMRFGFWNLAWSVHPFTFTIGTFPFQLPFGDKGGDVCCLCRHWCKPFRGCKGEQALHNQFCKRRRNWQSRQRPRWQGQRFLSGCFSKNPFSRRTRTQMMILLWYLGFI